MKSLSPDVAPLSRPTALAVRVPASNRLYFDELSGFGIENRQYAALLLVRRNATKRSGTSGFHAGETSNIPVKWSAVINSVLITAELTSWTMAESPFLK